MENTPTTSNGPLVSVALPVYNGEALLERAVASILGQTYENLELVISDNASTDATEEICRRLAAADPRVRYHRHPRNLGEAPNFNFAFQKARGKHFKWASHDDEIQATYIERCVAVLEDDEDVVLCHAGARHVDEHGKEIDRFTLDRTFAVENPVDRFRAVMEAYDFSAIWGVMRRSTVARTRLIPAYCGSDRLFLAEMVIRGRCVVLPDVLFDWRMFDDCYRQNEMHGKEQKWAWWDPSKRAWPLRLTLSRLVHGVDIAMRVPMPLRDRVACFGSVWSFLSQPIVRKVTRRLAPRASTG